VLGPSVAEVAATYDRFHSPEPGAVSPLMGVPGSAVELKARIPLLQRADLVANVTYQSIMTLLTAASRMADCPESVARIGAYVDHAQRIVTRKFYDLAGAKRKALALAGIAECDS
jgi:4-hydroxybutyryl-CoA dehydratase/vinylacetyl-CoA-Delta-isomerase